MKNGNEREEMKKVLETLVNSLKDRGLGVSGATIMDLGDLPGYLSPKDKTVEKDRRVREAVQNILGKMSEMTGSDFVKGISEEQEEQEERQEKCYCSDCFNFETFEKVLKEEGSIFDYTTFVANGKLFYVKYHLSPNGQEKVMVTSEYEQKKQQGQKALTLEELQKDLNAAVQDRDFEKAQYYLTAISELKTRM